LGKNSLDSSDGKVTRISGKERAKGKFRKRKHFTVQREKRIKELKKKRGKRVVRGTNLIWWAPGERVA